MTVGLGFIDTVAIVQDSYVIDAKVAAAKAGNLTVVPSDSKTLQLDFDTDEQYQKFISQRLDILHQGFAVERVWWTESKSGNKHVYVRFRFEELSAADRIALQAGLGSDPTRELLSYMGVRAGLDSSDAIVMFEKPKAEEHVIYQYQEIPEIDIV